MGWLLMVCYLSVLGEVERCEYRPYIVELACQLAAQAESGQEKTAVCLRTGAALE